MGVAAEVSVLYESATDTWSDISGDVLSGEGIEIEYGISGDQPLDIVAGVGECAFTVRGWEYSFHHSSVATGWDLGARVRVILHRATDSAASASAISRSGVDVTVTISGHAYAVGDWVTISGAAQAVYNGHHRITAITATQITYKLSADPGSTPTGTILVRKAYCRHNGWLFSADPEPGAYGSRYVNVISMDAMYTLSQVNVRDIALQEDKTEAELISAVLDYLPTSTQTSSEYRVMDAGIDTFPYAFDDIGRGRNALAMVKDAATAAFGFVFCRGDSTFVFKNRQNRSSANPVFTFNNSMLLLATNASIDELVNHVRVTLNPRHVDASAVVIYAWDGDPLLIPAGETVVVWLTYRNADQTLELIGGKDVVSVAATTDYRAFPNKNGTGTEGTGSIAATTVAYATQAKVTFVSSSATDLYLAQVAGLNAGATPLLQVRGKGVYQRSEQAMEAQSTTAYGDRVLDINLKYQDSATVAQSYALTVEERWNARTVAMLESVEFLGNDSADLLTQALEREPADVIAVTETATGAAGSNMVIQRIGLSLSDGGMIKARFYLAPGTTADMWKLEVEGFSELEESTILGW